jgi:hypothetical protein
MLRPANENFLSERSGRWKSLVVTLPDTFITLMLELSKTKLALTCAYSRDNSLLVFIFDLCI